jgi:hypothetical protein
MKEKKWKEKRWEIVGNSRWKLDETKLRSSDENFALRVWEELILENWWI